MFRYVLYFLFLGFDRLWGKEGGFGMYESMKVWGTCAYGCGYMRVYRRRRQWGGLNADAAELILADDDGIWTICGGPQRTI